MGGVETYLDWQARHLERVGIDLHFFGMEPPAGRSVLPSLDGRVTLTPNREFNSTKVAAAKGAVSSIYSPTAERILGDTINRFRPDLVHFHSTCRQLTPSVARAISRRRLPGVLTAHEYKQVCATQRLWDDRRGRICTACLSGSTLSRMKNVAVRRCVRGSTAASVFAIPEIPVADYLWGNSGVILHAPSSFMGTVLDSASYIPNRVSVLDLPWGNPEPRNAALGWERRAIYVGRLEKEKGVDLLLDAWEMVHRVRPDTELIIAGGGSQEESLKAKSQRMRLRGVHFTGRYERAALGTLLDQVAVSVHPSRWFENSPFAVRESLLYGVPAIVTNIGGMPEMVGPDSGTVIPPDDSRALADAIVAEFSTFRAGTARLRTAVAERAMSDDHHLQGLKDLYDSAKF
ncbi:glycosyltransferase [Mycolicibacterium litorale]|uniref:glycosyltransferase n=1 Tax=Mycolicibacterium litorale TaxID=758802 RepID=UPI00399F072E